MDVSTALKTFCNKKSLVELNYIDKNIVKIIIRVCKEIKGDERYDQKFVNDVTGYLESGAYSIGNELKKLISNNKLSYFENHDSHFIFADTSNFFYIVSQSPNIAEEFNTLKILEEDNDYNNQHYDPRIENDNYNCVIIPSERKRKSALLFPEEYKDEYVLAISPNAKEFGELFGKIKGKKYYYMKYEICHSDDKCVGPSRVKYLYQYPHISKYLAYLVIDAIISMVDRGVSHPNLIEKNIIVIENRDGSPKEVQFINWTEDYGIDFVRSIYSYHTLGDFRWMNLNSMVGIFYSDGKGKKLPKIAIQIREECNIPKKLEMIRKTGKFTEKDILQQEQRSKDAKKKHDEKLREKHMITIMADTVTNLLIDIQERIGDVSNIVEIFHERLEYMGIDLVESD